MGLIGTFDERARSARVFSTSHFQIPIQLNRKFQIFFRVYSSLMATVTEENAGVDSQRDWSALPIDVLGCVIGKLYWADRTRFCAVCKSWSAPPRCILPINEERPWLLSFIKDGPQRINLIDPYRKKDYVVQKFNEGESHNLSGFFWASRYGWIMSNSIKRTRNGCSMFSTLLFSPFTRETIKFPDLELELEKGAPWAIPYASFFINPVSPECVVYVIWRRKDWVWMATCTPGDTAWKTFKFPFAGFMEFQPYGVTYLAGSFYTISGSCEVGAFNLATEEWKLLKPSGRRPSAADDINYYGTVVHSDSELLWYECENIPGFGAYSCGKVASVWRFDFVKKRWLKEENFGNRAIFSSKLITYSVCGVGEAKDLAGMVFTDDQFVCVVNKEKNVSRKDWSYTQFYEWMVKEKKSKGLLNMWVDPRPVWKKSDLVKQSEVPPPANI